MKAWNEWTDDDLNAARDDILAAYRAMRDLTSDYDDLPSAVVAACEQLERAVRRLEAIDRKRLKAWNTAMAVRR